MTTNDDQKPMDTTEADSSAGVSCAAAAGSVTVQLCSRYGRETFKGDMVPLQGGIYHVRRMREENEREKNGYWQDRAWWLEDGKGNRVPDDESLNSDYPHQLST